MCTSHEFTMFRNCWTFGLNRMQLIVQLMSREHIFTLAYGPKEDILSCDNM